MPRGQTEWTICFVLPYIWRNESDTERVDHLCSEIHWPQAQDYVRGVDLTLPDSEETNRRLMVTQPCAKSANSSTRRQVPPLGGGKGVPVYPEAHPKPRLSLRQDCVPLATPGHLIIIGNPYHQDNRYEPHPICSL